MSYPQISINTFTFGEELSGALNDVGLGRHEDAEWFVEELFCRLKKYHRGYDVSLKNAEIETKSKLDIHSLEPSTRSGK